MAAQMTMRRAAVPAVVAPQRRVAPLPARSSVKAQAASPVQFAVPDDNRVPEDVLRIQRQIATLAVATVEPAVEAGTKNYTPRTKVRKRWREQPHPPQGGDGAMTMSARVRARVCAQPTEDMLSLWRKADAVCFDGKCATGAPARTRRHWCPTPPPSQRNAAPDLTLPPLLGPRALGPRAQSTAPCACKTRWTCWPSSWAWASRWRR